MRSVSRVRVRAALDYPHKFGENRTAMVLKEALGFRDRKEEQS